MASQYVNNRSTEYNETTLSSLNVTQNVTSRTTPFDGMIDSWTKVFRYHGTTLVVLVGCVSNTLAFLVIASSKMRRQSTGWYILSLAIVDTLVLITERISSLIDPRLDYIVRGSDITCRSVFYIKYAAKLLSAFIIVAINIERFAVVVFPFQGHKVARTRVAVLLISIFTIISFSFTSYSLDSLMFVYKYGCVIPTAKSDVYLYGSLIVDIGLGEILASLVVVILSIGTSIALSRAKRHRDLATLDSRSCPQTLRERQVTIMLLVISAAFVILKLPHTLFWVPRFVHTHDHTFPHDMFRQALDVTYVIALVNYAINFYLYCVSGRAFRKDFIELARKLSGKSSNSSLHNPWINQQRFSITQTTKYASQRKGSLPNPLLVQELAKLTTPAPASR